MRTGVFAPPAAVVVAPGGRGLLYPGLDPQEHPPVHGEADWFGTLRTSLTAPEAARFSLSRP
jgi:hypothetical protein